ncbi:MAG: hypothetical protein KGN79_02125 [Acidobacteriota bacterium]|nr:hypothetical protein [Acidobacteriota bacterium]
MKFRFLLILMVACLASFARAQNTATPAQKQDESAHVHGPDGLEGWTLNGSINDRAHDGEVYPFTLVIARHGKIIHRIPGDAFIWKWVFWDGGKDLAYMSGPLHFSATCHLIRISDWHQIADYDCYHDTPSPQPDWVLALESAQ